MSNLTAVRFQRDTSIDRLRGSLVILMVIGDYIAGINWIPSFLKHAPDIGFTIADTVAPAFVFVIGLNFGASFRRRYKENSSAAYRYFSQRYLSLIGIGAIITAGAYLADRPTGWGVLESLGVSGLITLSLIRISPLVRALLGVVILSVYQYFLDTAMLQSVLTTGHGGLFGSISWAALLLLSTAVADVWYKGKLPQVISVVTIIAAAVVSTLVIPVSKNRVSMSYILISLAISSIVYLLIKYFSRYTSQKEGLFTWWGKHSLTLYMVHLLVLSLFGLPPIPWWYVDAPFWLMVIQLVGILSFMSLVAKWLIERDKRSIL